MPWLRQVFPQIYSKFYRAQPELSRNPLKPAYQKPWPLPPIRACERRWLTFEACLQEIGHSGRDFCFNNEMPRHRVWLNAFQIASHPVTHGDFLDFIEDGGYRRPELWLSAGWDAVATHGWHAPLYWVQRGGRFYTFTLHGEMPVDPHSPCARCRPRASSLRPSASTTASLCAANTSCVAALASRRVATSGRATAISLRPRRAGSFRVFA